MKIAFACDHGGHALRKEIFAVIEKLGHEVIDFGTKECASVDYPDYAFKAAEALANKEADRAVLVCGSGVGMCLAANKVKGVRASVCHDIYSAEQAVFHNDMNALCLGARVIGPSLAEVLVEGFLKAQPLKEEKYQRRLNKIFAIEEKNFK